MSDTLPSTSAFLVGDDDELMFDEPDTELAPLASVAAELVAEPRRAPRRGRKSEESKDVALEVQPETANALVPQQSADGVADPATEPAGAPAPFPPQGVEPAGSRLPIWLVAVVAFALLSSCLSLGGLIAVGRSLSDARADRAMVASEHDALAQAPTLIAGLNSASAKLDAAASRMSVASPAGPPATVADLRRELDGMKLALDNHRPDGVSSLNGVTRDGFSEMATRMDRMAAQLDQLQRSGRGVSATPTAGRAAYLGRPS